MKSFLDGRPAISRNDPPLHRAGSQLPAFGERSFAASPAPLPGAETAASRTACEKKVEAVTLEGVVQKIIVTCSCGERIEVHCGY